MSSSLSPLDAWLAGENSAFDSGQLFWDPGFDAERRVVISKLGPYHKLFERPAKLYPAFFSSCLCLTDRRLALDDQHPALWRVLYHDNRAANPFSSNAQVCRKKQGHLAGS